MKRLMTITAIAALAMMLAGICDAFAQGGGLTDARKEFEITERVIEKVRRLVDESDNRRAEDALRRAIDTQRQARHRLSGFEARAGRRLTLVAREYAIRAGKLAGEPHENRQFVFRQLQKTREMLRRVRDELRDENGRRVSDLVRTAFERQDQAEAAFREQQFRVALRMTNVARELAHKALEMTKGEAGKNPGAVENALRRTDEVLGRVSRDLGGERPPLLVEAYDLQATAEDHFREGRLGPALKLTHTARDLAHRAKREADEGDGPGAVKREMEATRDFLVRAEGLAQEAGSEEALDMVRQGHSHLEEARAYLENNELVAARAQLKLARRKAERAMEVAGG
jgi:hypothetical protein